MELFVCEVHYRKLYFQIDLSTRRLKNARDRNNIISKHSASGERNIKLTTGMMYYSANICQKDMKVM